MPITPYAVDHKQALGLSPERLQHLENTLNQWVAEQIRPTIAVQVLRCGHVVFEGAYGTAGPGFSGPLTLDTIFPVASITKPIIATLLMILQEDGLVDLCQPVSDFFPAFATDDKKEVMLWHLLTHSSGIDDEKSRDGVNAYITNELHLEPLKEDSTYEDWKARMLEARKLLNLPEMEDENEASDDTWRQISYKMPLANPPHKVMSYCNTGYQMCKQIITMITKEPIDTFARRRIFDPLGMENTYWILPKEKWSSVVRRGEGTEGYPFYNEENCYTNESGSGGMKSTVRDILRFCEMIRCQGVYKGVRILSKVSVKTMCKNYNPELADPYASWALGFNIRCGKFDDLGIMRSDSCLDHGGYGGTKIIIDPEYDLSYAVFTVYPDGQKNIYAPFSNILYSAFV